MEEFIKNKMADGGHLEKKLPGGGDVFIYIFLLWQSFPSLRHVTGILLMFSCQKQSHLVLLCASNGYLTSSSEVTKRLDTQCFK